MELTDRHGRAVTAEALYDHETALSIYFSDPWGHNLEITTYDHDRARRALSRASG